MTFIHMFIELLEAYGAETGDRCDFAASDANTGEIRETHGCKIILTPHV